jgi:hypothetical protein
MARRYHGKGAWLPGSIHYRVEGMGETGRERGQLRFNL